MRTMLLLSLFLIIACEESLEPIPNPIVGKWLISEANDDPGDGSGTYKPSDTGKTVEFFPTDTVRTNGSFCRVGHEVNETGDIANYSLQDSIMRPIDCRWPHAFLKFEHQEPNLILHYSKCTEGCSEKYVRIE